MNKWMTAAAAASALSTAMPASTVPKETPAFETHLFPRPDSERARIVGIATEVRRIVATQTHADPRNVVAPLALADLGLSDAALVGVVTGLELKFHLRIEDEAPGRWQTVGDVVGFVAQKLREPRAGRALA
jgi:acyl carrier protein